MRIFFVGIVLATGVMSSLAQECPALLARISTTSVSVFDGPHGPMVGTMTPSQFPSGTTILECTRTRWHLQIGDKSVWIDSFSAVGGGARANSLDTAPCTPDQERAVGRGFGC